MTFNYDVIVVGAGHAGCEAAAAAANLGSKTLLITMDMNKIAQMSCNPAVGGIAKGQIVREIDALGGYMGIVTDQTAIQFRMLNRSKGPAMWSPRAQSDRARFIDCWRGMLENMPNLSIWQDMVQELIIEHGQVCGVRTGMNVVFRAGAVVLTNGTFLNGLLHIGRTQIRGGRIAEPAATGLTEQLISLGIQTDRMKTGTPVRIDGRSVHFDEMEEQPGENDFHKFSYMDTSHRKLKQLSCWTTFTNEACHDILREGLPDSPLYNGQIKSIGPRYCPSIETKIVTFADKTQLAGHAGEYAESIHLAGHGSRTDYRAWTSLRRSYGNECRIPCRSGGAYERDLPKRPASYRKNPDTGRTYRRACGDRTYRATHLFRYPNRSYENRNTGPYRWPERSLR